jgi:hypothetical protein
MHLAGAFNARAKELHSPLCLLGLFLDPRYRAAINTEKAFRNVTNEVSAIHSLRLLLASKCATVAALCVSCVA